MEKQHLIQRKTDPTELEAQYFMDAELAQDYYGTNPDGGEKQQLFKFIAGLRKHWLMILGISLLVTALVIIYEAQKPEFFKAETRVQINNEINPAAGTGSGGSSIIVSNPVNDPAYFTTQLQILEGSGLLRRVVKSIDLEHNEAFFRPNRGQQFTVWQNVLRMFGMYKPPANNSDKNTLDEKSPKNELTLKKDVSLDLDSEAEQLAPYVSNLKHRLNVAPVKDFRTVNRETRLIELQFTHNDPVVAAKVVNAIADAYVLQNLEQKVQNNAAAGDFLQKRVAELQSLIRSGEERLINYGKSNQILSLDSTQNTVVQRFSDLNSKLGQAENDRITAEAAYRSVLQNPTAGTTAESKDPRTAGLEAQLTTLRQKLEELKTEYTEEWGEVIQTRRQIASIEKEIQVTGRRALNTQVATLEQNFREAAARERELRSNFEKQRGEVVQQNEAAINYRIIQQDIDTNKTLLDGLLQRSRETDVILNNTPNNVRVVDRALVPRSPAGPERTKNIIIAFIASLGFGIGLSFLLNWLNDTISSTDDIESQISLPILGMIPATGSGLVKKLMPGRLMLNKSNSSGKNFYDLESFKKPAVAESYLQLRTHLLLSTAGGPPQTILVTSGQPGEGKTVTAINLAKSLAQTGAKVLIIDADLRYPRLHTINNINNSSGLSTLLTVKEIDQDVINQVIQNDIESNLDILTAGPNAPNPANILGSTEMCNLLADLKNRYSHIVIDSPPVLLFADSIILSSYVDAVTLVVRYNITSQKAVLLAKKKLQSVGAKLIGVIFNGIPLNNSSYHNYGYYQRTDTASYEEQQVLGLD